MYHLIFFLFFVSFAFGSDMDSLLVDGDSFSFNISIHSSRSKDQLFKLLTSDSATLNLRGSAHSVKILQNEQIETIFQAFGYRAVTITEKKTLPDHKITIMVKSFSHNWKLVPQVKFGCATYNIEYTDSGSVLIYSHEVKLDRPISWFTKALIKWQLKPFIQDLRKLIDEKT